MMRKLRFWLLVSLLPFLAACPIAKSARDTIAASSALLEQAQKKHLTECRAQPTKPVCQQINRLVSAENAAIDLLTLYCSGTPKPGQMAFSDGGPCCPDKAVEGRLRTAIANLDTITKDVGGIIR